MQEKNIVLSCYLIKCFPIGHRVICTTPDKPIETLLKAREEHLYYIHFLKNHFEGKMDKLISVLNKKQIDAFICDLIHTGFLEGKRQYNLFKQEEPYMINGTIYLHGNAHQAYHVLRQFFDESEMSAICVELLTYGMNAVNELDYEDIFQICQN